MIRVRNLILFIFSAVAVQKSSGQNAELMIQTGNQSYIQNLSLSQDETKIFSVDAKSIGILWDVNTGRELRIFQNIRDGQFMSDNRSLSLIYVDGAARDVDFSGNVLKVFPASKEKSQPERVQYDKASELIFYRTQATDKISGSVTQMGTDKYGFDAMIYAPLKGQVVWSARKPDANLFFFDVRNGQVIKSLKLDVGSYVTPDFFDISKDNNLLLVGSTRKINIIDFTTGNILKTINGLEGYGDMYSAVMSRDGKTVFMVMNTGIAMLDVNTDNIIWTQRCEKYGYGKAILNIAGDKIVISHKGGIEILNSQTGTPVNKLDVFPVHSYNGIQYALNKTHLFSEVGDRYLTNWNLLTGNMEKCVPYKASGSTLPYAVTQNGNKLFKSYYDYPNATVSEINVATGENLFTYPETGVGEYIKYLNLSFDQKYLVCSRSAKKDQAATTPPPVSVFDVASQTKILDLPGTSLGAAIAHTKNVVATKNTWDGSDFSLYEIPSGKLLNKVSFPHQISDYNPMLFSNSDRYLATEYDKEFCLYDFDTQKQIHFRIKGASEQISFTPDDKFFVVGGGDGIVHFFNIETQQYESNFELKAHIGNVKGISFSKNGHFMFTCGADNTIKVWDWETKTLLATLYSFPETNDWAVVTPGGRFDATKGAQENMYYVKGETTIPMSAMFEKFYTPRLLSRILEGEKIDPTEVDVKKLSAPPTVKISAPVEGGIRNLVVEDDKPSVHRYEMTSPKITLTIQADCPSGGVTEIRLYHNNKLIGSGTRNLVVEDEAKTEKSKSQKFEILLVEGLNNFRAVALNTERTESQPDEINVNYKATKVATSEESGTNLYMLVVGINKYKNPKYTLNYASADATGFKEAMEKNSNAIFNKVNIVYLGDENANKEGIVAAFDKVRETATAKDVFIFYYAGHGVLNEKKNFYIVPQDVTQLYGNDDALAQKGISAADMQQFSKNIKAQKQLFILDACQSAGAIDQIVAARGAAEEKAIAQLARSTGTHWLTASGSEQYASEFKQLGHGTFTYVLLEALSGKADIGGDKKVTVKELDAYLQEKVPEITAKYKGTPQYPSSYSYGNDFPIIIVN